MTTSPSPLAMAAQGQAPEVSISKDLVKRGLIAAPVVCGLGAIAGGADGAWSSLFALGLILLNFSIAAWLISVTARISLGVMMGAILFGYIFRLGLITLAVLLVKDMSWVSIPVLGITIIVTHLGLLFWEMKYVAASLAFPGLKPDVAEWRASRAPENH